MFTAQILNLYLSSLSNVTQNEYEGRQEGREVGASWLANRAEVLSGSADRKLV